MGVPIMMKEYDSRTDEDKLKEPKELGMEQVNETKPIWKKQKSEITKDEYKTFYNSVSSDWNEPLFTLHNNVEGMVSYKSILFSPRELNMYQNLSDPNLEYGPKLYVQNVLILENAKELLPLWLRFVSGVVETNDLPLNISREMLQDNASLDKIKKGLTKKVIGELKKSLKNDNQNYEKFWLHYGKLVKEGIHYEADMKEEIAGVSLFTGIKSGLISLDDYLAAAPETTSQPSTPDKEGHEGKDDNKKIEKTIYYIVAKSESEAKASPYMAQFIAKDINVLLLTDPIDSFLVQGFNVYKDSKLVSITSDDVELDEKTEADKKESEEKKKDFASLFELIKNTIGDDKIDSVVLNDKLGHAL